MNDIEEIEIYQEPIELYKLLKFANLVMSGGEAKLVIEEGLIYLNGELETRKAKKIYEGDLIDFEGQLLKVKVKK